MVNQELDRTDTSVYKGCPVLCSLRVRRTHMDSPNILWDRIEVVPDKGVE